MSTVHLTNDRPQSCEKETIYGNTLSFGNFFW